MFRCPTARPHWLDDSKLFLLPINSKQYLAIHIRPFLDMHYSLHCFIYDNLDNVVFKVKEVCEAPEYYRKRRPIDYSGYYEALVKSTPDQYWEITDRLISVVGEELP